MVVINFLHVNHSLSILQCMWNRSQANMFVFRIKLLKHLLVKSCGITKYFRLLLCNLRGLSAFEIILALLLFPFKFQCCLHYVIINGKYQHSRGLKYTADFVLQIKTVFIFRLDTNLQTFIKCFRSFSFSKICNI